MTVDQYTTNSWLIFHRVSMVNLSAECRPLYRPRYQPIVGQCVNWHLMDILADISVDMSTDTSVQCWLICQPIHWSSVGWYVDWYIGRGVHKLHMIRKALSILSRPCISTNSALYTYPKRITLLWKILAVEFMTVWLWPVLQNSNL